MISLLRYSLSRGGASRVRGALLLVLEQAWKSLDTGGRFEVGCTSPKKDVTIQTSPPSSGSPDGQYDRVFEGA